MLPAGTFKDRVAIVTGGGTGIGKTIAGELARLGARVVVASRKQEHLDQAVRAIEAGGGRALAVPTDIRQPDQVDRMVEAARKAFGRIDLLINNAAGNFVVPSAALSVNGWNAVIGIVLNGTFYCTRAVAPTMIDQKYGRIVNLVAAYAWTGGPGTLHSACAKAGVITMTKTLAVEWAQFNIRVNAVAPGPVETEGAGEKLWPNRRVYEAIRKGIPVGRFGRPDEVAWLVSYLCSDYADFINGDVITQDGGEWLNKGYLAFPMDEA